LERVTDLGIGDWVGQTAANSAVGRHVISLAKRQGIKTLNIVRRDDAADEVRRAGGDIVLVAGADLDKDIADALGDEQLSLVALMNKAVSAGYLQTASLTLEELGQMHINHRPRKLGWPAAQAALVLLRQPRLQIRRYRLLRAVLAAGMALTRQQFTGTLTRIKRGDNREAIK
jgi:D-arabinose 1-dehydrogenase-like Zn-dependent alcohol dehydrogenase